MKYTLVFLSALLIANTAVSADQLVCKNQRINRFGDFVEDCHWVVDLSELPKNIPARETTDHSIQSVKQYNDHEVRVDRNDGTSQYCSKNILGEWSCN